MGTFAAIGVDNNLTTSKSGVSMRASNDKLTRRIDKILNFTLKEFQHFLAELCLHTRHKNILYIIADLLQHPILVSIEFVMLC